MENKNIYIPGDIVKYVGICNEPIVKIDTLLGKKFFIDLGYGKYLVVGESEIAPVLLTPKILEKNGWEFTESRRDEMGEWHIYSKEDILPDMYYYPEDGDFSAFVCGEEICPGIKYVHQLQHLLFGLGFDSEIEV